MEGPRACKTASWFKTPQDRRLSQPIEPDPTGITPLTKPPTLILTLTQTLAMEMSLNSAAALGARGSPPHYRRDGKNGHCADIGYGMS